MKNALPTINAFTDPTKPLGETTMLFAHNAYNSAAYGAMWPNQSLSISEVLTTGVNGVELDVYFDKGELRLCHLLCADYGMGSSLKLEDALAEINKWMQKPENTGRVVFLKIEDHLDTTGKSLLSAMVKKIFDPAKIFTPENLEKDFSNKWPSLNQIHGAEKNLVIMPQSDFGDTSMFAGGWGGQFKQSYLSGNIARAKDLGFEFNKTFATQLIEVGEDQAPLGKLGDLPHKLGTKPFAGGTMTRGDIEELRKNGVNIISVDHIKQEDSRFYDYGLTLNEIQNNPFIFIPASIIAGAAMAVVHGKVADSSSMSLKSITNLAELGIKQLLSIEGKIIFRATKEGVLAYNRYIDAVMNNRNLSLGDRALAIAAAAPPVIGGGLVACIESLSPQFIMQSGEPSLLSSLTGMAGVNAEAFMNFCYSMGLRALVGGIITKPVIGAVKGAFSMDQAASEKVTGAVKGAFSMDQAASEKSFLQRIEKGFLQGIESSFFGFLFKSDLLNKQDPLEIAARRWQITLDSHPWMSKEQQRILYDRKVMLGRKTALENGVREVDMLPYPSFEELESYLDKNKSKVQATNKENSTDNPKLNFEYIAKAWKDELNSDSTLLSDATKRNTAYKAMLESLCTRIENRPAVTLPSLQEIEEFLQPKKASAVASGSQEQPIQIGSATIIKAKHNKHKKNITSVDIPAEKMASAAASGSQEKHIQIGSATIIKSKPKPKHKKDREISAEKMADSSFGIRRTNNRSHEFTLGR